MSQDLIVSGPTQPVTLQQVKSLTREQRTELKRQCQMMLGTVVVTAAALQAVGKLRDLARQEFQARIILPWIEALERHDAGLTSDRQLALIEAMDTVYTERAHTIMDTGMQDIQNQVRFRTSRR